MRIITQSENRPQCSLVNYAVEAAGNLRTVSCGGHIVSYTYGDSTWADLLTGVSLDGVYYDITYASPGNPSNWFNDTVYTNLTWTQGRRLKSITKGSDTYSYENTRGRSFCANKRRFSD